MTLWRARRPWWIARPKLAVVLSGGATLGAFQVGVIDAMARRGVVPDLLVGTSVGAINAAFWAVHPQRDVGQRLLGLWLSCTRTTMFPDGPLPMVGRLFQRKDHLTTQRELARLLRSSIPDTQIETTSIPLAIVATGADHGERVVLRSGSLLSAVLASSAIPGLWPAVEVAGRRLVDGGLVANCDLETAVELGMSDVILVDVMSDGLQSTNLSVGEVLEHSVRIAARRQTELAIRTFGIGLRIALLRASLDAEPHLGDFSLTQKLFLDGRSAGERFLVRHLGPRRSVRPGVFEEPTVVSRERTTPGMPVASAAS
jgi:NTE family protein